MITKLTNDSILKSGKLLNDYYGRKIISYYEAYGIDYDFCRFYVYKDGVNTAVLLYFNNNLTIASNKPIPADELSGFVKMLSPYFIEAPEFIILSLSLPADYTVSERICFRLVPKNSRLKRNMYIDENPSLDRVYDILREGFPELSDYGLWLTDTSHRQRHGITRLFMYMSSATASVLYDKGGNAFVGHIATAAYARGKGYASELLYWLAAKMESEHKTATLFAYPDRVSFYSQLGFEPISKEYVLIKKEDFFAGSSKNNEIKFDYGEPE